MDMGPLSSLYGNSQFSRMHKYLKTTKAIDLKKKIDIA